MTASLRCFLGSAHVTERLHAIADEITVDIHVMGFKPSALQDAVGCPPQILQGIEQGAVKVEHNRLYLHRFSPLLVTDNHYLVLMYTKIDLCSVFYKTSTLLMRYIRKDIITANGNPVSDGAS